MLIWFICVIALVFLDQLSKWLAVIYLEGNAPFYFIPGFLRFSYVENRGAAFGMLQNAQVFFIIATIIACGAMLYFMIKEYRCMHTAMRVSLALIFAGALGNFIDRVALGHVRDMLYFELIDFPVFNVADSAICVGAAILIIDLLFFKGKAFAESFDKKNAGNNGEEKE